ncbi:MAG TPA: efflux RND transporter permease subunit [Isosphaeraceae bacterium]|nr:efflux RND transporter permease subunit [Isosphaeraceae bacterium]
MNGLIRASLGNPHAVTVMSLTMIVMGVLSLTLIPIDILPVFKSPAVQTLTFYGGMSAESIANDITNRMERWTGQANGTKRQDSRSIIGASIVRNYFFDDVDPNGALTQVNSLALGVIPNLPPGTLPPVVLPFDPTAMTPICVVAVDSPDPKNDESVLYDVGRYEVRNYIMGIPGAVAPVVFGGKIRTVLAYLNRQKMQARDMSPIDVMKALDASNVFLPSTDGKFGTTDFVIDSNSMYLKIEDMKDIPLRYESGKTLYLGDVATPKDANYIQTNVVRVNGKREVYIPVYRQLGASTLGVVSKLKGQLKDFEERLTRSGINLKLVMDQSVYVRKSIEALVQEGVLGAILCSLTILMFLGEIRMTAIAIMTLPISIMASSAALYFSGQTINVMTLAGMTLAIGPMIDSAIICLENTHRHLGMGATTHEAAFLGASEVAMPELVSTLCTFLVLSPLVLTPGLGQFLFKPMAMGVAYSMIAAYFLSRTLVPACSAYWLKPHGGHGHGNGPGHGHGPAAAHGGHGAGVPDGNGPVTFTINGNGPSAAGGGLFGPIKRAFHRWEEMIDTGIGYYVKGLDVVLRHRILTIFVGFGLLGLTIAVFWPILRREFFPEVDAGAFEMYVRAPSGTRIEVTEQRIKAVEDFVKKTIDEEDLQLVLSELGVTPDWSAAYTPNAGPMDAVVKIQLSAERKHSAQEYVHLLRTAFHKDAAFNDLEFAFDAGGMVRSAMNEGKSTPISIRVTGKDTRTAARIAGAIKDEVKKIDGVVDARVIQRLDYPQFKITVDRLKAAELGLTQAVIMQNVVAAFTSSIQFNKHNFWIDPKSKNQYFVGVQYPEDAITDINTLRDIPITPQRTDVPKRTIPLSNVATIEKTPVPTEVTHYQIQPTIELTMGVSGRDLGHVSDDVSLILNRFGTRDPGETATWLPFDPDSTEKRRLPGSKIVLSGEYLRMKDTFNSLGVGLGLASLLIYFLMVGLDKSFVVPLSVMSIVPLCLVGIMPMLYVTGSAVNVQSLLGFIFIVGIKVANSVLMTDYAQELRRHEGLTPMQAIRKAASLRVRPITMTALAAFFALIPGALALERGSESNAPLARAILGGLLAGEPATLFVLPAIYSLIVRESPKEAEERLARQAAGHGVPAAPPEGGWEEDHNGGEPV